LSGYLSAHTLVEKPAAEMDSIDNPPFDGDVFLRRKQAREQRETSKLRLRTNTQAESFVQGTILDSRFMNYAQNQGDEVHDEAIEDWNKAHFNTTGNDIGSDVVMSGKEICHLQEAAECPEYAHDKRGDAGFLNPGRSFPRGKEQANEEEGDDNHPNGTAGNEEVEKICS